MKRKFERINKMHFADSYPLTIDLILVVCLAEPSPTAWIIVLSVAHYCRKLLQKDRAISRQTFVILVINLRSHSSRCIRHAEGIRLLP